MQRIVKRLPIVFALFGVISCASAGSTGIFDPGTLEDIRNLQGQIEELEGGLAYGEGSDCENNCRIVFSICDCAMRICQIASDLAEMEALESCRRAESHCHQARAQVSNECTCPEN